MRKAQGTIPCGTGLFQGDREAVLLARWRQVRATAMRHLSRHAYALAQRGVWVNRLSNVHRIRAHLDGQSDFANQVARVGADDAAAYYDYV